MTNVYITIDTEYSSGLVKGTGAVDRAENYARSIACITPDGPAGITLQLEMLARSGQRAVFFVDPMPALIWGVAAIEDVVGPIMEAGQDIQLHCHTEWLALSPGHGPVGQRTGQNIADFAFEDQCEILDYARQTLMAAGAPKPVAFRAGNYGANDDTLRALAAIGLRYDTSHCPGIADGHCKISLGPETREPVLLEEVIEVPVGSIGTASGGQRHAQITALSLREMTAALYHARDNGVANFTFVSHSFELINRRTLALNKVVRRRFEGLCHEIAAMRGVETGNYRDNAPLFGGASGQSGVLPHSLFRTGMRTAEQFVSNSLYGAL